MASAKRLVLVAVLVSACAAGNTPTPQIIYVTPLPVVGQTQAPGGPIASDATEAPTDAPTAVPPTTAKTVTVKGTNSRKTKPFSLGEGDYDVTVSGKGGYDNVIVDLYSTTDSDYDEFLTNEISKGGSYHYDTSIYGVPGGKFYLDVEAPTGSWTVTFTPQ